MTTDFIAGIVIGVQIPWWIKQLRILWAEVKASLPQRH